MDDKNFQMKNVEFHLKQASITYDKCVSQAVRNFLDSQTEFSTLVKGCAIYKQNVKELMEKYEKLNNSL